jgi:hypothetical protein
MPDGGEKRFGRLNILRRRQQRYKAVFAGIDGEWVLADLYRKAGIMRPCHVPGDPCSSAFQDGAQSLVKHIALTLGESADRMLRRTQEHIEDD